MYLSKRLNAAQRKQYFGELSRVGAALRKLAPEVKQKHKIAFSIRAIENVVATEI